MTTNYLRTCVIVAVLGMLAGCAASPEAEERRRAAEADIDEIMSLSVDEDGESLAQDCLRDSEYRDFRALGGRYIVFEGRDDRLWISKLRNRCMDLEMRPGSLIAVRSFSSARICQSDTFSVSDWFDYRGYGTRPGLQGRRLPTGTQCMLGNFVPISEDQLAEIEAALERMER